MTLPPLIGVHNVKNAAVMGEGAIDGRGDKGVIGRTYTWWEQSRAAAKIIPAGDVASQGVKYSAPRLVVADHADGLILYKVRLHNSPNFHVTVSNTDGFTAWGVHLLTPTVRGEDARNTDGIDPGSSRNITVTKSWIDNGDDNIAIKANVQHMSVLDNHFYSGHGMSIGSEARDEDGILVDTLTLDHTTSGIRVKSNVQRGRHRAKPDVSQRLHAKRSGARVHHPVLHRQTADGIVDVGMKGDRTPDYKQIALENVLSLTPGVVQVAGLSVDHPTEITFNGVEVRGIRPEQAKAVFTHVTLGPMGANFTLRGNGVTTTPAQQPAKLTIQCAGKFPPYQD